MTKREQIIEILAKYYPNFANIDKVADAILALFEVKEKKTSWRDFTMTEKIKQKESKSELIEKYEEIIALLMESLSAIKENRDIYNLITEPVLDKKLNIIAAKLEKLIPYCLELKNKQPQKVEQEDDGMFMITEDGPENIKQSEISCEKCALFQRWNPDDEQSESKGAIETSKALKNIFNDLWNNAYDAEYHHYEYKQANQIIRKHIEAMEEYRQQPQKVEQEEETGMFMITENGPENIEEEEKPTDDRIHL